MSKRVFLSPPHMSGNEMKYIQDAFDSNWITPLGKNVDGFEYDVSTYVGVNHALALSSGTAAIHLALKYLGVGESDYVFCSSLTFSGSCNAIAYEKAIPVFIDSEPESWNMSPIALQKAFAWASSQGKLPKAVIIVDLYGQSADYDELLPICEHYGVPVIEDAAEALGASYNGKKCGSFGNINVFSFNGNKIITTSGGGMAVSNDADAIHKMKFWSTQSREAELHYEHKEIGYNYRMSNICAGIGRGQMEVIDERVSTKKKIYQTYETQFQDIPQINMMPILENGEPNYWLSVITLDSSCEVTPTQIINKLAQNNIESRPVWKPMHLQPVFRECKYFTHDDDISAELFRKGVCLPSGSSLKRDEQEMVINIVKQEVNA